MLPPVVLQQESMLVGRPPFRRELQGVATWRNPDEGSTASLLTAWKLTLRLQSSAEQRGGCCRHVSIQVKTCTPRRHKSLEPPSRRTGGDTRQAEWSRHRMKQTSRASLPIEPKPQSGTAHVHQPPTTQGKRAVAEPPANNSLKNRRSLLPSCT